MTMALPSMAIAASEVAKAPAATTPKTSSKGVVSEMGFSGPFVMRKEIK
jgi:hypothetical protein